MRVSSSANHNRTMFDSLVNVISANQIPTLPNAPNGLWEKIEKEPNISETLKLFQKTFDYLFNAESITPSHHNRRPN